MHGGPPIGPAALRPHRLNEPVLRDNSGNWLVLVEQKAYTAEDFT